jgi:hypothetical protein
MRLFTTICSRTKHVVALGRVIRSHAILGPTVCWLVRGSIRPHQVHLSHDFQCVYRCDDGGPFPEQERLHRSQDHNGLSYRDHAGCHLHIRRLALSEQVLQLRKSKLGEDHPGTLTSMQLNQESSTSTARKHSRLRISKLWQKLTVPKGKTHRMTLPRSTSI